MPTITSTGVGSGLDVNGLVEKLVAAEGEPVRIRLDRKEAELQAGLSAMGTFKGAVSELQTSLASLRNSDTFGSVEASTENEDILAVIANNDAQPGEYEVDIIQLATAQKLSMDAFDSDLKPFGTGAITIQVGRLDPNSNNFSINPDIPLSNIVITSENNSLRGIQQAINQANAGVRASIINDGTGYRLVISSLANGTDNSIRITVSDDDGIDTDLRGLSNLAFDSAAPEGNGRNLNENRAAQDALINIDGIQIASSSNEISDAIPGVTLDLKPESSGQTTRFSIALSSSAITEAINNFITKYNEMITTVEALTGYDPETKTAGPLSGDSSIRGVVGQIRRELGITFSDINTHLGSLSRIGIDTTREGTLKLDSGKLDHAIDNDRQELINLFALAGSTSDPLINYIESSDKTASGVYELVIAQLATQGSYNGRQIVGFPITVNEGNGDFSIKLDGIEVKNLSLPPRTYFNAEQLANELETTINGESQFREAGLAVSVSFENGRLVLISDRYGHSSSVEITAIMPQLAAVSGLTVAKGVAGVDVEGHFNGVEAIGSGQILTAEGAAEGLKVEVTGGQGGPRGKVYFSHGIAARLHNFLEGVLTNDGVLSTRTEGFNYRIDDITKQREQLAKKLEASEQRYMQQFSSLDTLLGKMRSTGDFLNRQLSALPGANKTSRAGNS